MSEFYFDEDENDEEAESTHNHSCVMFDPDPVDEDDELVGDW